MENVTLKVEGTSYNHVVNAIDFKANHNAYIV
jgi:hypothetical protein